MIVYDRLRSVPEHGKIPLYALREIYGIDKTRSGGSKTTGTSQLKHSISSVQF